MKYYRYEDPIYFIDERPRNSLELYEYEVLKTTLCGVWIKYPRNDKYYYDPAKYVEGRKFILEKGINHFTTKRFAWPTKEEALISYKMQKEKQIRLLESQLSNAIENLEIAQRIIL